LVVIAKGAEMSMMDPLPVANTPAPFAKASMVKGAEIVMDPPACAVTALLLAATLMVEGAEMSMVDIPPLPSANTPLPIPVVPVVVMVEGLEIVMDPEFCA
jgi:hypothetical protein